MTSRGPGMLSRNISQEKPINPSHIPPAKIQKIDLTDDGKTTIKREAMDTHGPATLENKPTASVAPAFISHLRTVGPMTLLSEICSERPIKRPRTNPFQSQTLYMKPLEPLPSIKGVAGIENQAEYENDQQSAKTNQHTSKSKKGQSQERNQEKMQQKIDAAHEKAANIKWIHDATDKYMQHDKQVEDDMSSDKVRQGFKNPILTNEHGSAKDEIKVDKIMEKLGADLLDVKAQKYFQSCFLDNSSKIAKSATKGDQVARNYVYSVLQHQGMNDRLNNFFAQLSGPTEYKKLLRLRLPDTRMNQKGKISEVFYRLANFEVPIHRAIWYIKAVAHAQSGTASKSDVASPNPGSNEPPPSKSKKNRGTVASGQDGYLDWTTRLVDAITEFSSKLLDPATPNESMMSNGQKGFPLSAQDGSNSGDNFVPNMDTPGYEAHYIPQIIGREYYRKYWDYLCRLACQMFEEKLLDRQEFLQKIVTLFDTCMPENKQTQAGGYFAGVKFFLPLMLCYVEPACKSHFIARKLAWATCRYLSMIYSEEAALANPLLNKNSVIIGLSAIVQCITLGAPGALVWYPEFAGIGSRQASNTGQVMYGGGSPLDICPIRPSELPFEALQFEPSSCGSDSDRVIRDQLAESEQSIIQRSNAVEQHWSCDRWRADPVIVETLSKLVYFLNYVDYDCYRQTPIQASGVFSSSNLQDTYKSEPGYTNCIVEQLYEQVFETSVSGGATAACADSSQRALAIQDATVGALCQWAISTERRGRWRATLIAKLLEKRQDILSVEKETGSATGLDDSNTSMNYTSQHSFQTSILKFLDQGPVLTDPEDIEQAVAFQQLMQLMAELIRHDVFNYSAYLNFMICTNEFHRLQLKCEVLNFSESMMKQAEPTTPNAETTATGPILDIPKEDQFLWGYDQPRHVQYIFHIPLLSGTDFTWMDCERGDKHNSTTDHDPDELATEKMDDGEQPGSGNSSMSTSPTNEVPVDFFEASMLQNERSQRLVMLYGTGRNKSAVQNCMQKLTKQLTKALFRMNLSKSRASGSKSNTPTPEHLSGDDASADSANSAPSPKDGSSPRQSSPEALEKIRLEFAIKQLYSRSIFERTAICCQVVKHILIACNQFAKGRTSQLPSVHGIVRLFSLLDNVCFAPQVLIAFTARLASLARAIEQKLRNFKQSTSKRGKSPVTCGVSMAAAQANFFTRTLGLNCAAIARQHHSLYVIEAQDSYALQQWFDGFWGLVKNSHPSECSSAERNIFFVLYEQWITCQGLISTYLKNRYEYKESQIDWIVYVLGWPECEEQAKPTSKSVAIKKNVHTVLNPGGQEEDTVIGKYNKDILSEVIDQPYSYPNGSQVRKMAKSYFQEDSANAASNRYSFVCNVVLKCCSGYVTLAHVSQLAAVAAEMASYAPKFSKAWMAVITAITSQHANDRPVRTNGSWQECLLDINLSDTAIYEPFSTLLTSLLARGVIDIAGLSQHCIGSMIQLIFPQGASSESRHPRRTEVEIDQRLLNGPKLTLYLLLRIYADACPLSGSYYGWKSKSYKLEFDGAKVRQRNTWGTSGMTFQADRRLLAAQQDSLQLVFLFAITKSLIVLADKHAPEQMDQPPSNRGSRRNQVQQAQHFLLTMSPVCQYSNDSCGLKTESMIAMFKQLKNFGHLARRCLKLITAQQAVKECFLMADFDQFGCPFGLADETLNSVQKQLLVQHFIYPRRQVKDLLPDPFQVEPNNPDNANSTHIMLTQLEYLKLIVSNTTLWNMRQTVLELRVMHTLIDNGMADDISKALTSIFNETSGAGAAGSVANSTDLQLVGIKVHCAWLVGYVIQKLDPTVQKSVFESCKVILQHEQRNDGNVTSSGRESGRSGSFDGSAGSSPPVADGFQKLQTPQPFLNLILNSLEGQAGLKDLLVESLTEQINQIVKNLIGPSANSSSRAQQSVPVVTEAKQLETRNKIRERLPLRLSLIGGMMDAVIRNQALMVQISKLLINLIASGLVAVDTGDTHDDELFYTTYDMLAVILWNCIGGDAPELYQQFTKPNEKHTNSLMRAIKKETGDRVTNSLALLRMLAPLPRLYTSIVTYEPKGIQYDEHRKEAFLNPMLIARVRNNMSQNRNKKAATQSRSDDFALQYSGLKILNPWDIVEAVKPLASLNLAWFGARLVEREPEFWESEQRLIKTYYLHNGKRDPEYYLAKPNIEELLKEQEAEQAKEALNEQPSASSDSIPPANVKQEAPAPQAPVNANQQRPTHQQGQNFNQNQSQPQAQYQAHAQPGQHHSAPQHPNTSHAQTVPRHSAAPPGFQPHQGYSQGAPQQQHYAHQQYQFAQQQRQQMHMQQQQRMQIHNGQMSASSRIQQFASSRGMPGAPMYRQPQPQQNMVRPQGQPAQYPQQGQSPNQVQQVRPGYTHGNYPPQPGQPQQPGYSYTRPQFGHHGQTNYRPQQGYGYSGQPNYYQGGYPPR